MGGGNWKQGVGLGAATLLGAFTAFVIIPKLFARIETDQQRTKILLSTLRDIKAGKVPAPDTLVFGNSVTMNGVDTELVAKRAGGTIYNFSSTGQSLAEAFLYFQDLPPSVKTVLVVVSPGNLETDKMPPADVLNTFYMDGYRPAPATRQVLTTLFDASDTDFLTEGEVPQRFHSRWAIAQVPDTEFRKKIRKDLETKRSIRSLTYPAPYTKRIPAANFEKLLPTYDKPRVNPAFSPLPSQVQLLKDMAQALGKRKFYIVLAPMNPRRLALAGPRFIQSIHEWGVSKPVGEVPILDLSDFLKEDQFIDVVHPTRDGAVRISAQIGEFLASEEANRGSR